MIRLSRISALALVAAGSIAATAPASAAITTFAAYTGIDTAPGVRFQNDGTTATNGTGGSIYTIAAANDVAASSRLVKFSFLQSALSSVSDVTASFTLLAATASPAQDAFGFKIEPDIAGGFSFLSTTALTIGGHVYAAGANLLSGTFTDAAIAGKNGATSAGFGGSTSGGATITYTSDFLNFSAVTGKDFAISLTSLTPVLYSSAGKALGSFQAYSTGSFSSDPAPMVGGVPEPSVWGLMIVGFGMVGFQARRRSASIKTVTA